MTRIVWGAVGQRFFEAGADRGVLYVGAEPGVPWNGLKAVKEAPTGGEPRPYYIDGIKFQNLASSEEYAATLEALSAPAEFGVCDGTKQLYAGLFITQQPRVNFGLCYRTKVGNDTEGLGLGYKLHLVWNALAAPSSRDHTTVGESSEPMPLGWNITTIPPVVTGMKPSAHMVVDSRTTPIDTLSDLEDLLYGTNVTDGRLPTQTELIALFAA